MRLSKGKNNSSNSNNQERPITRADIAVLKYELEERINTIMFSKEADYEAIESGNLHQPYKEKFYVMKARLANELEIEGLSNLEIPWVDKFLKSEGLNDISNDICSRLASLVSVTSFEMGEVLSQLKGTYQQTFSEIKNSWYLLYKHYKEIEKRLHDSNADLFKTKEQLEENNKVYIYIYIYYSYIVLIIYTLYIYI